MEEVLVRYVHLLGIILFSSGLFVELYLLSEKVSAEQMKKLVVADRMCGVSIIIVLISGLLLWFFVGKPSVFYSGNWVFYVKLSVLFVIFLLAIYPAIFFIRNQSNDKREIEIPKRVISLIRTEVALLIIMSFLAVVMARGYGIG